MVSPRPLRRSTRNRTATRSYHDLSQSPPAIQRRKAAKTRKKAPSRDSEEQQSNRSPAKHVPAENTAGPSHPETAMRIPRGQTTTGLRNVAHDVRDSEHPTQQVTTEDTAAPSNPDIIRNVSRGRKRKARSDYGYHDNHAGPKNDTRDDSDRRQRKQRIVEAPPVTYHSIEIPPRTEGEIPRPVSRQESESVYQDENQENIPPDSELSTAILSAREPEHRWRFSRSNSTIYRHYANEHVQKAPIEEYEDARYGCFDEYHNETTSQLHQTKQLFIKNEEKIEAMMRCFNGYEDKFGQMEEDIGSLVASLNLSKTYYKQHNHKIIVLAEKFADLEREVATLRPARASSTQSTDARILNRLDEIRRAEPGCPYFETLDDKFFHHFGIKWIQLWRITEMPDEIYGAYHLRARTQVRIGENTAAPNSTDKDIIEQADCITSAWLVKKREEYPGEDLRKKFAWLFRTVCEREVMGNPNESPQQDLQPAPRRAPPRLAPSAME
ncbi:hypothetical protein PISL3812_04083 [Talaromyces islandicus]|uniref:Uncharacterized protein n=1 Tax=Talaromyces islandicus TaxID=28573 RepID=A0A0U1LUI2_TALIS|nr:hypothetical protein PISL3812_04083 [Talaromyces islandicus]